jgi:membrane protease YdiL (CAAX protease family)
MITRFFALAFLLCWIITIPIALQTQNLISIRLLPPPVQWLIGIVPFIAAVLVARRTASWAAFKENLLRFRVGLVWYAAAIVLPWAILLISLGVQLSVSANLPSLSFEPSIAVFALIWFVLAFGEEAGWRGFALPRMVESQGFWKASTVLGVLWCVWHYPKLFCSPFLHFDYQSFIILGLFSVQIIIANYLICWLFMKTRSVMITSLFHTSWNLVATVHMMAAIHITLTLTLAAVTAIVLYSDRASVAGWVKSPARKMAAGAHS